MSMTHDEMIAVITHHKNGGRVQGSVKNSPKWFDYADNEKPLWDFNCFNYRAKPEPLVLWINLFSDGSLYSCRKTKEEALDDKGYSSEKLTLKKFVEVSES